MPEATVMFMVDVPAPVMDDGVKLTVTPEGCPEAVKLIAELKPPVTVLVIVELPLLPCTIVTEDGEAERLKSGVEPLPVRALIKPLFGLPHPVTRSYPVTAEKLPEVPLVMSWKSDA